MPTDVLPEIDIPVVSIVWQYGGLAPDEMEQRFTGFLERGLATTVNGIQHIESQSLYGVSVTLVGALAGGRRFLPPLARQRACQRGSRSVRTDVCHSCGRSGIHRDWLDRDNR